jgi:hypothetical protein
MVIEDSNRVFNAVRVGQYTYAHIADDLPPLIFKDDQQFWSSPTHKCRYYSTCILF